MRGTIFAGLSAVVAATCALATAAGAQEACPRDGTLGVARTVEIDTTGGPGFGMQHYKAYDFLQPKEIVLTFDDGPQKYSTEMVLKALADECAKATFFSIGKMALGYPEIIRDVVKQGHTVGTHTWSHQNVTKAKTLDAFKEEIEKGVSGVTRAAGAPVAPFFRYPTLKDSSETLSYLASRNLAVFSTDIDSFDFKLQKPEHLAKSVLDKVEKAGKGIVLMHDIHKRTAEALPLILKGLREKGFKLVHLTAKGTAETVAQYDELIEKDAKGLPQIGAERPTSAVVRTIEGTPPDAEAAERAPTAEASEAAHQPTAAAPVAPAQPATPAASAPSPATATASISSSPVKEVDPSAPKEQAATAVEKPAAPSLTDQAKALWNKYFGQ